MHVNEEKWCLLFFLFGFLSFGFQMGFEQISYNDLDEILDNGSLHALLSDRDF